MAGIDSTRLCTRRRVLSFLKTKLQLDGDSSFNPEHMEFLIRTTQWKALNAYLLRFNLISPEAASLNRFIAVYRNLDMIGRGGRCADAIIDAFPLLDEAAAAANPIKAMQNLFLDKFRRFTPKDPNLWHQLWESAARKLTEMALRCPELAPKTNLFGMRTVPRLYKRKRAAKSQVQDMASFFEQKR
uniref:Uncharacterized protein n=1 Tax=Leersia perrieri TaxID=77586 RepID=A0A0D9XWH2_9ORYZ